MIARFVGSLAAAAMLAVAPAANAEDQGEGSELNLRTEPGPRIQPRGGAFAFGPRVYGEAGVSVFGFTGEDSESVLGGTLRGGVAFNQLFAIEADFSVLEEADGVIVQVVPDSGGLGQFTSIREPDQVSTAFARGSWPLTNRLSGHARLGFARVDSQDELGRDEHTSGAAFGAGAQYRIAGPTALRFDYTRMQLNDLEADVGTLVFAVGF